MGRKLRKQILVLCNKTHVVWGLSAVPICKRIDVEVTDSCIPAPQPLRVMTDRPNPSPTGRYSIDKLPDFKARLSKTATVSLGPKPRCPNLTLAHHAGGAAVVNPGSFRGRRLPTVDRAWAAWHVQWGC